MSRYILKIPGNKKDGTRPHEVVWSTHPPPTTRLGPENIMSKPRKLSEEAAAAETPAEMWSLFFDKKEGVVLFSYFILLFSKIFAIQIY
jgi:hypothetical protein